MYQEILTCFNLNEKWTIEESTTDGSCFFDSFRQCLGNLLGIEVTTEELRRKCKHFAENNNVDWLLQGITNNCNNTTGEVDVEDLKEYCVNILRNDRWGNPETEGRILCQFYDIKLGVIEKHFMEFSDSSSQTINYIFTAISKDGVRQQTPDFNDDKTIFIVNNGENHFVPLLRIRNSLHVSQTNDFEEMLINKYNDKSYNLEDYIASNSCKSIFIGTTKPSRQEENESDNHPSQSDSDNNNGMDIDRNKDDSISSGSETSAEPMNFICKDEFQVNGNSKAPYLMCARKATKSGLIKLEYSIFNNKFEKEEVSYHRKSDLKKFHNMLEKFKIVWVYERSIYHNISSGVGKTMFMEDYAELFSSVYHDNVIWIKCETFSSFQRQLEDLNKKYQKKVYLAILDNVCTKVYMYLSMYTKTLQVDNGYLVIITNYKATIKSAKHFYEITRLKKKQAVKFVKKMLNFSKNFTLYDRSILRFCSLLCHHPLAMKMSLSYILYKINIGKFTFDNFIDLYKTEFEFRLDEMKAYFKSDRKTIFFVIYTVLSIIISEIQKDRHNGRAALEVLFKLSKHSRCYIKAEKMDANSTRLPLACSILQGFSIVRVENYALNIISVPKIVQYISKSILLKVIKEN